MDNSQTLPSGGTTVPSSTRDADILYARAAAEFGQPLGRLAAAYESEPSRQEDPLQELHFALWRSFTNFNKQCSLRTWVYRVAHNTATTYVRQQRKRRRIQLASLEDLDELANETDVERLVDSADVRRRIRHLVDRLKPIDRDVFLLYLEGLPAAEIGDVVGMSPEAVAQKIHRAQKCLKHLLLKRREP